MRGRANGVRDQIAPGGLAAAHDRAAAVERLGQRGKFDVELLAEQAFVMGDPLGDGRIRRDVRRFDDAHARRPCEALARLWLWPSTTSSAITNVPSSPPSINTERRL